MTWSVWKYKRHLCYVTTKQDQNDMMLKTDTRHKGNKRFSRASLTKNKGHNYTSFGNVINVFPPLLVEHRSAKMFPGWSGVRRLGFSSSAGRLRPPSPSPAPAEGHRLTFKWRESNYEKVDYSYLMKKTCQQINLLIKLQWL